jgi:ribosomal protein S12 methylthiotransferase
MICPLVRGPNGRRSVFPGTESASGMAEKVALVSLGCPKNLVDSEMMLGQLKTDGYELTTDAADADVIVVNTCGFLGAAAQESVDALLEAAERKKGGKCRAVIAAGCMTQRFGTDAAAALPEIDGFIGVGQVQALPGVVRQALRGERAAPLQGPSAGFEGYGLRIRSTPAWSAYVKVSEGCDRKCAFCVIPSIRGPMVSRPIDTIVAEATSLAADGCRELVLVGQDPTRYGVDRGDGFQMAALLRRLARIEALRWIRLMYLFPDRSVDSLIDVIADEERICPYVDIPFQHASRSVLRRMNRPGDGEEYLQFLEKLRRACPDVSVRSTFITGFPGETERDFETLLQFVDAAQLDWVGVFTYSQEEGSPAATMPDPVPKRVAQERRRELMRRQHEISAARRRRWVGRTIELLMEKASPDGRRGAGRSAGQAPEIDGVVRLTSPARLAPLVPGQFIRALVKGSTAYDLDAVLVDGPCATPNPNPNRPFD